jgi:hypothetical protein
VPEPGILVGVAGAIGVLVVGFVVGFRVGWDECVGVGVGICLAITIGVGVVCISMCMLSPISGWDGEIWLFGLAAHALNTTRINNPSK